jgi:GABA permease
MHNPLRSEADAFRWIVVIGIAVASVIAVALLTRSAVAVAWAAALVGFGAGVAWSSIRGTGVSRRGGGRRRILVLADETVGGRALLRELQNRSRGGDVQILLVTPALAGPQSPERDVATELARQRLELSLQALHEAGLRARGQVGDHEPNRAIEDALREFAADEIVISTHPSGRSPWLQDGVVERARREIELPVTHVVVDLEAETGSSH